MPAIWLTWYALEQFNLHVLTGIRSIVLYIACILSFVWRTNAQDTQPLLVLSHLGLLLIRILISSVLALGLLYMALVLKTFRHYGEPMDRAWKRRIDDWMQEREKQSASFSLPYGIVDPVVHVHEPRATPRRSMSYGAYPPVSYTSHVSMSHRDPSVTAQHGGSEPGTSTTLRKASLESVIDQSSLVHNHSRVSGHAGDEQSVRSPIISP